MTDFEKVDKSKFLAVNRLFEPDVNELLIEVSIGKESDEAEDLIIGSLNLGPSYQVNFDDPNDTYILYFDTYISYFVINGSYEFHTGGNFSGEKIREYTSSAFLDFCKNETFAFQVFEEPIKHFQIVTQRHIINVLTTGSLSIKTK